MERLETLLGNKKYIIGDKGYDLVLESLGKIYLKQGNKLTNLEDLFKNISQSSTLEQDLYILRDVEGLKDIPDYRLVYFESTLFIKINGKLEPLINPTGISGDYVKRTGDRMTGVLEIETSEAPLKVSSVKMVKNLNSEFLDGKDSTKFAQKEKDEEISGSWLFRKITKFIGDVFFNGSLTSGRGFASGFGGYGWKLDASTNTLTIDNLVVRKLMSVYELVVNKISATNGSLWISSAAKIKEVSECVEIFDSEWSTQITDVSPSITIIENNLPVTRHLYKHYFLGGSFYKVTLDDDNYNQCPFRVYDIIRCQKFEFPNVKYYDAVVTYVDNKFIYVQVSNLNNNIFTSFTEGVPSEESRLDKSVNLSIPESGDSIVRIGNIVNRDRQGSIYMSAEEEHSPYIDIMQDVNRPDFSVSLQDSSDYKYKRCLKVRLGNLDGIYDPSFGLNQPRGFGLYGSNIFIKGVFVQVEPDGSETPMTVWKDEWKPNVRYYVNNQVSFQGQVFNCIVQKGYVSSNITPDNDTENWKLIIRAGTDGNNAPEVIIMYSADTINWHTSLEVNDLYAKFSTNNGITWSTPFRIVGEDGQEGPHVNFKFKLAPKDTDFNPWNGQALDSTWLDAPQTVTAGNSNFMTTRYYVGNNPIANSSWSFPVRITGDQGENGLPGENGPSILFYGAYNPEELYNISQTERIIVYVFDETGTKQYYQTKTPKEYAPIGPFQGIPPNNFTYWKPFGSNFKSLATEVLFAEYANIGGLIFKDQKLISQSGKVGGIESNDFKNPNFFPNLIIDGNTGFIDMIMGTFGKQPNGTGFFVQGGSIFGKTEVNGKLINRIQITTDALPPLNSLLDEAGGGVVPCSNVICHNIGRDINTGKFDPPYVPDILASTTWDINIRRAVVPEKAYYPFNGESTRNQNKETTEFTIQPSPLGFTQRILKVGVSGINATIKWSTHSALVQLYKKHEGQWYQQSTLKDGINYINVTVGETYKIKLTLNQTISSDIFQLRLANDGGGGPRLAKSITYAEEVARNYTNNYPDLDNCSWIRPAGVKADGISLSDTTTYPNWGYGTDVDNVTVTGNYFNPVYISETTGLLSLSIHSLLVFDAASKTIIANDGFCSYWGPENYFYFQKDVGLLTRYPDTSQTMSLKASTDLETRVAILEQKINNL